MEWKR